MNIETETIDKVVRIGTSGYGTIFCKIKYSNGKLSISGVEGPTANGSCKGGCGQITDTLSHIKIYYDGWTAKTVKQFQTYWNEYHLNDMRPYSPEMKAAGWLELAKSVRYKWEFCDHGNERGAAYGAALAAARSGQPFAPTPEQVEALNRPMSYIEFTSNDTQPTAREGYELFSTKLRSERKTLGWITPEEHPDGLLGRKLNPEDEFGYGSKWWTEPVPEHVLVFLASLPSSTVRPAWV